jgi:ankyrin repeat protein
MLDHKADINARTGSSGQGMRVNEARRTSLLIAFDNNSEANMILLLERKADVHICSENGQNVMYKALQQKNNEQIFLLACCGANPSSAAVTVKKQTAGTCVCVCVYMFERVCVSMSLG